jgi:hypothetical protein
MSEWVNKLLLGSQEMLKTRWPSPPSSAGTFMAELEKLGARDRLPRRRHRQATTASAVICSAAGTQKYVHTAVCRPLCREAAFFRRWIHVRIRLLISHYYCLFSAIISIPASICTPCKATCVYTVHRVNFEIFF